MRALKPIPADIVMVNHVWLTGELLCDVTRNENMFQVEIAEGGYFSFHEGREETPPFHLNRKWGRVNVMSQNLLSVELDLKEDDRVIVYNRGLLENWQNNLNQ